MATEQGKSTMVSLCQHQTRLVQRVPDADAFYALYSGGVRSAEVENNVWMVEPIIESNGPSAKGFFTKKMMHRFFEQYGFQIIAFHRISWTKGEYSSSWCPIIPGQSVHMRGPADLWSSVASNLMQVRIGDSLRRLKNPTMEDVSELFDGKNTEERLARSISLSLRNLDISIEQIADFYNEQLVNHMSSGSLNGARVSTTQDQSLYAHAHSFFVHAGAARDYLAALCAHRLGKDAQKIDSMARLLEVVRKEDFQNDEILKLFYERGYFREKPASVGKYLLDGWLNEITGIRNEFVHKRPFGGKFIETMGYTQSVDLSSNLYKYVRPIMLDGKENDLLDSLCRHYREITYIFHKAAAISDYETSMVEISESDIVSINLEK